MVTTSTQPLFSDWCVCTRIGIASHWSKVFSQGALLKPNRVVLSIPVAQFPRDVRTKVSSHDAIGLFYVSSSLIGWSPPLGCPSLPLVVLSLILSLSPRDPDSSCPALASSCGDVRPPCRAETTNQQEEKGNFITVRGGCFLIFS